MSASPFGSAEDDSRALQSCQSTLESVGRSDALRRGHIPALPCPRSRGHPPSGSSRIAEVSIVQQLRRHNVPGLARNHHYVPQWVLRQWSSEPRCLWVAKRVRGIWDIRQRSIKRSFSHDGLYDSYPPVPDPWLAPGRACRTNAVARPCQKSPTDLRPTPPPTGIARSGGPLSWRVFRCP